MIAKQLSNSGRKHLAIIVPYRDRKEHLDTFIPHIKKFLANLPLKIYVVEQMGGKPFNRGKLLNVGYTFAKKNSDYLCFHDVDMLPIQADYSYVNCPTHLATHVEQFDYAMPFARYFGGVTLIDIPSFEKVNGYCNEYWGWGREDDDFLTRCELKGLPIYHREGRFLSLSHPKVEENNPLTMRNQDRYEEYLYGNYALGEDGLATLSFELIGQHSDEDVYHLLVDI